MLHFLLSKVRREWSGSCQPKLNSHLFFQLMSDSDMLTVSLGTWMELPNLSMKDWKPSGITTNGRVNVSTVSAYYRDYVKLKSLSSNFAPDTFVTEVRKITDCAEIQKGASGDMASRKKSANNYEYNNAVFQQESLYSEQNEALAGTGSAASMASTSTATDEDDVSSSCTTGGACSSLSASSFGSDSATSGAMSIQQPQQGGATSASASTSDNLMSSLSSGVERMCLSTTRMGQYLQTQARRRANTTCCLEWASNDQGCDYSWDPIVFAGCSLTDILGGAASSACTNASSFGRSYTWKCSNNRQQQQLSPEARKNQRSCPVSKCFNAPHVWEVSGFRTNSNGVQEAFRYSISH